MVAFPKMLVCLPALPMQIVPMARCVERVPVWIVWMIGIVRLGKSAPRMRVSRVAAVIFLPDAQLPMIVPMPTVHLLAPFAPNEVRMVAPVDSVPLMHTV